MVETRVLTPVNNSKYFAPVFVIPNKKGMVDFITYYLSLNQHMLHNTYPLSRIDKTMKKLE